MRIPKITGIIRRRFLLNYRVRPEVIEKIVPSPFRPKLKNGYAVAGICLIRLEKIRPVYVPSVFGISSENSAHRIAVEWDEEVETKEGVFVPRRDTDSPINALAGGRIFPGVHRRANFQISDNQGKVAMKVTERGSEKLLLEFEGEENGQFPAGSIFENLAESSAFFQSGRIGYSPRTDGLKLEGLLLKTIEWKVSPLSISKIRSAYFDDCTLFPPETIAFDHALLMRDVVHEWHSEPTIATGSTFNRVRSTAQEG